MLYQHFCSHSTNSVVHPVTTKIYIALPQNAFKYGFNVRSVQVGLCFFKGPTLVFSYYCPYDYVIYSWYDENVSSFQIQSITKTILTVAITKKLLVQAFMNVINYL